MDYLELRALIRELQDKGMIDPYKVSAKLLKEAPKRDHAALFAEVLPDVCRKLMSQRRHVIRRAQGDVESLFSLQITHFVPSLATQKKAPQLTAEECEEVAEGYEARQEENSYYAQVFRAAAIQIRLEKVNCLGELRSISELEELEASLNRIRSRQRELIQKGQQEARNRGVVVGSHKRADDALLNRIASMYEDGLSCNTIATVLQSEGIPTVFGRGKWHPSTVRQMVKRAGVELKPRNGYGPTHCKNGHSHKKYGWKWVGKVRTCAECYRIGKDKENERRRRVRRESA